MNNSKDKKPSNNTPPSNKKFPNKNAKRRNFRMKNLSPAKKFRLRLRLEKFQKRWQSREEYFEHDTRDYIRNKRNLNAKKRKYYNNADKRNRSRKLKRVTNTLNIKTEENQIPSKIDTTHSVINAKSSAHLAPHETARISPNSEDAKKNNASSSNSSEIMKCCCHCTCARASKKLRKPRRKLSSPYLGDFDVLHFNDNTTTNNHHHGNCSNAATKFTVMTTTQHQHHKYIEANVSAGNCSAINPSLHDHYKSGKYSAHKLIEKKSSVEKKKLKNGKRFLMLNFIGIDINIFFLDFQLERDSRNCEGPTGEKCQIT